MVPEQIENRWRRITFAGGAVWVVYLAVDVALRGAGRGWIERLFLTGPLMIVPAALLVWETGRDRPGAGGWKRWMFTVQPVAAALLAVSFLGDPGHPLTVLAATPWILVCGGVPLIHGWNLLEGDRWTGSDLLAGLAAVLLPVGGFWLGVDRLGTVFMGIPYPITLLTGVHFHFTGYAVPLLLAGCHRYYRENGHRTGARCTLAVGAFLAAGIPLIAGGFVYSQAMKTAGVLLLVVSMTGVALLLFGMIPDAEGVPVKVGLAVSGASIGVGIALAAVYQISLHRGHPLLSIPTMTVTHGVLNPFGFLLCGLFATHVLLTGGRDD